MTGESSGNAPWRGTLRLTADQRRLLRRIRWSSDALIDALLPTVEYIAYWRRLGADGVIDTATRRRWSAQYRTHADAVRRFRDLLLDEQSPARFFLARRAVERGAGSDEAMRRGVELADDLAELEAVLERFAADSAPRRGAAARVDEHLTLLLRAAASEWRRHTGRRPGSGESSPFLDFVAALCDLAGLQTSRDKVQRIVGRGN